MWRLAWPVRLDSAPESYFWKGELRIDPANVQDQISSAYLACQQVEQSRQLEH